MTHEQPTLKQTQDLFWRLITAPNGVKKALEEDPAVILPIKPSLILNPAERLDIYADMYFFRILDSLKEDYPALLKILGDDPFHNLVTEYLLAHPSTYYTIDYVGENVPSFLIKHPLTKKWPFLPELAQYEWALLRAFVAPDSGLIGLKDLESIPPTDWPHLIFQPVPSLELLLFRYPVHRIREKTVEGTTSLSIKPEKTSVCVWRKDFTVLFRSVDDLEVRLLKKLLNGKSFADLCDIAAKKVGFKQALPLVASKLKSWIDNGLIASV